jgi:hypothetical protein
LAFLQNNNGHISSPSAANILTFIMVELHTGTNFPAVSLNPLLAAVMMKNTER